MAEVTSIIIKIGKKTISLKLDEAKELQKVLGEILGQKVAVIEREKEIHHYDHWVPQPYWLPPLPQPINPEPYTITCGSGSTHIETETQMRDCQYTQSQEYTPQSLTPALIVHLFGKAE